jgi:putative ABC transport system permease protein
MPWLRRVLNTLRPARIQPDIDRELAFHIAERIDQLRAEGLSNDEATRRARVQFGNAILQRERTRDVDIARGLDTFLRNARHAVRTLISTPGFSVTVVLTLALGIGANAAVFSAIDAVLLRPLPFPDSEQLMRLRQAQEAESTIAPPRLEDWNRLSSSFQAISGYYIEDVSDTTGDLPQRLRRAVIAPRFLEVLNVTPALGHRFSADEYRIGGPPSVLISDRYWRTRLARNPDVLGTAVRIADRSYSIVGVLPADFAFPDREVDLWWPYPTDSPLTLDNAENRRLQWYTGIGRLRPGADLAQAREDLSLVQAQLAKQYPVTDATMSVRIVPLAGTVGVTVRSSLWLLYGAVSLLLIIACLNIAALLLSRTAKRDREIALRVSLGASRVTIAGELFAETAVLVLVGAATGVLVAAAVSRGFHALAPRLPRLEAIGIEPRMLLYSLAAAVVVALMCGLLPAIRGARSIGPMTHDSSPRMSRHSLQWSLVGVQVALSVTLLSGAALLMRTLDAVSRVEPGFDAGRILVFRVSGNWNENYDNPGALVQRIDSTLDDLASIPGVEGVATSWTLPGAPGPYEIEFESAEGMAAAGQRVIAAWRTVSPGYFNAMGIPLLSGSLCRSLLSGIHRPGSPLDIMVNRRFADRYFAGGSPIGARLSWDSGSLAGRIAGIVGDARELGIDHDMAPTVYSCDSAPNPFPWFIIRTEGDPALVAAVVRQRLHQLEPLRFVYDMAPLEARIGDAYAQNRLRAWLLTLFSVTALGLVCTGIYGTLSYAVGLRRREVALRLALGALRRSVVQQLMTTSMRIVGASSAIGLFLALFFTQSLSTMLYGVTPTDPATLSGVMFLVVAVAFVAAFIPAVRATFVQPMRALREE